MSRSRFMIFPLLLLLITAHSFSALCLAESTKQDTNSAIFNAEGSIKVAYISVIEADKAGSDVSALITDLNNALGHASTAKYLSSLSEFDAAKVEAKKAKEISDSVVRDAVALTNLATYNGEMQFRNDLIISTLQAIIIIMISFSGWSKFKDYYLRRMAGMKPEVTHDEP